MQNTQHIPDLFVLWHDPWEQIATDCIHTVFSTVYIQYLSMMQFESSSNSSTKQTPLGYV